MNFDAIRYYKPIAKQDNAIVVDADLCIYGGSSAGIAAAIQASRMGVKVVIAEFGTHLGGLTTGGLGATDIGNKAAIGGISREFYVALGKHYGTTEGDGTQWTFEPSVAKEIYMTWLEKAGIIVHLDQQLVKAIKKDGRIQEIHMSNGNIFKAGMFIDATYEGDLLAAADVSYHVGRESNNTYQEVLNGIHFGDREHDFKAWVDPYRIAGKPDSGLLHGVSEAPLGIQGQGDASVQAYNFRICLTNDPANRAAFPAPPNYDPEEFTLQARYINAGIWDTMLLHKMMPNNKTDLNNKGAVSTDYIGQNHRWPEGSYEEREEMFQAHFRNNLGMLYFLSNDERLPQFVRDEMSQWGLPKDEYLDSGMWTPQLYIREGRRMISDIVMTEHYCRKFKTVEDSIGLAAYTMDSHNCRRVVLDGRVVNEGNVEVAPSGPYPISYRSIVPKGEECTNLLVPICLSASHIAFGSIRMEPVFMILGQSAATAAVMALAEGKAIQDISYAKLRSRLLQDQQVLEWRD